MSPFHLGLRLALVAGTALAASLSAQDAKPAKRDSVIALPDIQVTGSVTGQGKTRASSEIKGLQLKLATAPGTSALRVIQRIPGVNVQSADAFGAYEWSTRVTIRGFQTQQIGQTFDGIPLGDMSYGNFNGLNIARAVDPENLDAVGVAQGAGALGTASANNLGGAIQYTSADPENHAGGRIRQLFGNYNARRTYLRLESGARPLGANGLFKGYLSYSRTDNDKTKGSGARFSSFPGDNSLFFGQSGLFGTGQNWQDHLNTKLAFLLGGSRITAFYDYSEKKESDYMDLTLGVFRDQIPGLKTGPDFDYFSDWNVAKQYAQLAAAGNPLGDLAYYHSAQGARLDHLAYVAGDFALGERTRILVQPYFHINRGGGDWHAPSYGASYSPDPVMFRQSQYRINRRGVTARLSSRFDLGSTSNRLEAGVWLESNSSSIRRPRWRLKDYQRDGTVDFTNVLRLDFDRTGDIGTQLAYLQNTSSFSGEKVRLTYGVKLLHVGADFTNNGNTPTDGVVAPIFNDPTRPAFSLPTPATLLPQAGIVYQVSHSEELFGNYAENVNQFPYSPSGGVYNTNPAIFDYLKQTAKPERSTTFDLGIRTRHDKVEASASLYHVSYRNRLLPISLCPPTVTCATGIGNVGSVRSLGIEGVLSLDIAKDFRWYTSGSYNSSTFRNDYRANPADAATLVKTGGKDVQDAPRALVATSLTYSDGKFFASVAARHVDKRFFTYTNDLDQAGDGKGFAPAYNLVDASLGYTFTKLGGTRNVDIRLNTTNLFDEKYVSTIGSNGFGVTGDNQTLLSGARRQVFVTVGFGF